MAEEIPLSGLSTEQLLVRTVTVLNQVVTEQRNITKAFKEAADLHWLCLFFPGRGTQEGKRVLDDVEHIKEELSTTKAYLQGLKRGLVIAVIAVIALGALYGGGQVGIDLKTFLSLLKGGP